LVAGGKKITHGNAVDGTFASYAITCEQVSACTP
jgi:hypothetical protein